MNKMIFNKPTIFFEDLHSEKDVDIFRKEMSNLNEFDFYTRQLEELFRIRNPELFFSSQYRNKLAEFIVENTSKNLNGNWIYFPWNNSLVHILKENDYFELRTNRNRNLITREEQKILYNKCVGIAGMSIGGNMAVNLAYSGITNKTKLSDFDIIETCNLNRMQVGLFQLYKEKIKVVAERIYEINPYADLIFFQKGLNNLYLDDFFSKAPIPDIVFDVIDDFEMKIKLRIKAKECGIPVIMLTNLGDSILIDIERYDLNSEIKIFNGLIGELGGEILKGSLKEEDKKKLAVELVGRENITERALLSVKEINRTLVGRPQLMSTVSVGAGLASYLTRKILLSEDNFSGRKLIKFNSF